MADVDEDNPLSPPADGGADNHIDLSDETQDFRFLSIFQSDNPTIPKRGIKDFEPHGTAHQADLLAASRHAMHTALSSTRIHLPKSHLVGYWHGSPVNQCEVKLPRGPHFKTMGRADREGKIWLLPEEMLYMLERGGLDVRWGNSRQEADERGSTADEGDDGDGLPMSLQGAYAVCIGDEKEGKISLDRWCVYSGLKRSGYIVSRARTWQGRPTDAQDSSQPLPVSSTTSSLGLFTRLYDALFAATPKDPPPFGPIIAPGLYRSYNEIHRLLTIIPSHNPTIASPTTASPTTPPSEAPPLYLHFTVHKPTPTFKKSAPGPPDYLISVLSARTTTIPTLSQLSTLLAQTPYAPPPSKTERGGKSISQRLKHGYRNVILAVVDEGVVSYIRVADAAFGLERVGGGAERGQAKGGRRGGRGGGRGARGGRGRGR